MDALKHLGQFIGSLELAVFSKDERAVGANSPVLTGLRVKREHCIDVK
jgi:hypothetical protein